MSRIAVTDRYCIIGAGPSGLATAKAFVEAGIPFDCLEREDDVGGTWYFGRPGSSIYESTHLISSKRMTQFPDFPMPKEFPPYPHHTQALAYLRSYARHFQLYGHIAFGVTVERVERDGETWWVKRSDQAEPRAYGGLVVANGHHWDPLVPAFRGTFTGQVLHAHDFKSSEMLRGRRVLVVGAGNSGCDIAVEAAQHATSATLSMRRGYHFLPKFLYGRPIDSGGDRWHRWGFPLWLRRQLTSWLVNIAQGPPQTYGLPAPDHQLFETHPIINSQLLYHVGHGRVRIRPDVAEFGGERVRFRDGTEDPFDLIIFATGYRVSVPFLDSTYLFDDRGNLRLYLNAFHPELDHLFVIGLIQPNSGLWPLSDLQARVAAQFVTACDGNSRAADWFRREKQRGWEPASGGIRFLDSPRHRLEVEYFIYRKRLRKLLERFGRASSPRSRRRSEVNGAVGSEDA